MEPDDEPDVRLQAAAARLRAAQANYDHLVSSAGVQPELVPHAILIACIELESAKAAMERLSDEPS
jgi:hypothetical protein